MTNTDGVIPYRGAPVTHHGIEMSVPESNGGRTMGRLHTAGGDAFDQLRTIFAGQRQLMDRYHEIERNNSSFPVETADLGEIDFRLVQARLHELFGFLVRELGEAMQELRSKPWKQNYAPTDVDKFIEEMADSLHFYVEMCITAGVGPDRLFQAYFKAWEKNRGRQDNGYHDTGSTAKADVG